MRASGSSAGALVLGAWAAGLDAVALGRELVSLRREHFWDPRLGPGLLRGRLFRERLRAMLPTQRFEHCRVPLAVSVYDVLARRTRVLADGDVATALVASCAVPLLFHPVWIDGRPFVDGGVADRPGLAGMPLHERVLFHHLASRSPWRRRGAPSLEIPRRESLVTLVVEDLPRVGPFRLEAGRLAFDRARTATRTALDRPIEAGVVRIA